MSGVWQGGNTRFDSSLHKIGLDFILGSEMRKTFSKIDVEVLGLKNNVAYIGLVTDTATGSTDGTITAGDDIRIEGDRLRIAPLDDEGLGVFFIDRDGQVFPITRRLTQNDPKTVIARVPDLPTGQYRLRMVTRFSTNAQLLKERRVIEYERLLTIK